MAVLSDVIGRGYGVGRAIGDDISRVRYGRAEERIRQKYEALASEEGKSLQDYLPQMEAELRQAGTGMFGADRRGVTGDDRQPLSAGAIGRLQGDVLRAGERRAGALAMSGDQQGARQARAGTLYGLGRFDDGQGQQIAGDTIGATSKAVNARGEYDPAAGALAMSGVSARYGDQAGAERNATAGNSFRMQAGNAIAGNLATMFQNPSAYTPDQIRGTYEGLREKLPDLLAHTDLQVGDDGVWNIYANGSKTATGSFDPKSKADQAEFLDMMQSFTRDPSQVISSYQQARLKAIEEEKTRRGEIDTDYRKARIDAITSLTKDAGISGTLASKIINGSGSSSSSGSGGGWQLQEIGEDQSTYMVQKNGKVFVVKTNVPADPTKGEVGGPVQVFEADGVTPVAASALNASEKREAVDYVTGIVSELAKGDFAARVEAVKTTLEGLRAAQAADLGQPYTPPAGGALSRAERNNNMGNIEDRGQFRGMPGYLGSDGRFARFETPEQGQQAHYAQLQRYMQGKTTGQPLRTVSEIVGTWSPASDPGNAPGSTANYARYVAQRLGVSPTAPLTEADIPRLAQAMGEFESGNTVRGQLAATAPAAAAPAQTPALPAAAAPAQRARISPDYVRSAASEVNAMAEDFRAKRDAYEKFVRDNGGGTSVAASTGRGVLAMGPGGTYAGRASYRDPAVQRVHDELKSRMDAAEQKLTAATAELRSNTGALNRQTASANESRRAADLAAQYDPGVADIFSRLQ